MRRSQIALGICVLLATASSALAQKVITDYDHHAPFSDYKTYTWVRPPHMGDPLMNSRLMDAVNAQLTAKGWQLAPDASAADVGVTANGATREVRTLDRFYGGFGGWGWRGWGGPGVVTVQTFPVGTLVVDIFDGHTKQLVWRGRARDTLSDNPNKNTKKLDKAVEKMFKNFPPK